MGFLQRPSPPSPVEKHFRTFLGWGRRVVDRIGGELADAKRHVSGLFATAGAVLLGAWFAIPTPPSWLVGVGGACFFVALVLGNRAAGQQAAEALASDIIEWEREGQEFRDVMRRFWDLLNYAWNQYATADGVGLSGTLTDRVEGAGWPDRPDKDQGLALFCEQCITGSWRSIPGHEQHRATIIRTRLGDDSVALRRELTAATDYVDIWSIAVDSGGGRQKAVRDMIRRLRRIHEPSLKLLWYLSEPYTESRGSWEPDWGPLGRVRSVMLSESDKEADG